MFFKRLTKRTIIKGKTELKYNFFFWNKLYGRVDEEITHKLDYIPENWIATQFSSLHSALVYDTQTFVEQSYMNPNQICLQIKHMGLDYTRFPTKKRNIDLLLREYLRIRTLKKSTFMQTLNKRHLVFTAQIPSHTIFLATNFVFLRRRQLKQLRSRFLFLPQHRASR
jgi:hypothetical protein